MISLDTPIVLAFTPNYFIPAVVCIQSIVDHAPKNKKFHVICLLTEKLPENMERKLRDFGEGRIYYSFINLQGKLKDIYVDERYTIAASYRLLLPDLLSEYDKIIYIDCDVIVRNDLSEIYHQTILKDNYLAAVYEAALDTQIPYLESIGCKPGYYINSGFLIMNLEELRRNKMVPKFLEASKAENLQFPDQDVLNQLCGGHITELPPYYNSIPTFFLPQYKKNFLVRYTENDWKRVQQHGTIHYTGGKPWNGFTVKFDEWWKYYDKLPQEIKNEWNINKKIYFLYRVYKTGIGKTLIETIQKIYRLLKY